MSNDYPEPVSKLLTYGDARPFKGWPDYLALDLTREHIPELIRMATDDALNWADSESLEVWAPIHAWRALGQLRAEEAIGPLLELLADLEESDWARDELPEVFGMIGPKAIPALAHFLSVFSNGTSLRISGVHALERIGNLHPEARAECVAVLTRELERFNKNDPDLNGFLVCYLADLHAVEALPTMRKAYRAERVDYTIIGDIEDVEIHMGLRRDRATPVTYPTLRDMLFADAKGGEAPGAGPSPKVGRNDPCPCGSGKKYKKCCLNK
jgi:hypothetical protein